MLLQVGRRTGANGLIEIKREYSGYTWAKDSIARRGDESRKRQFFSAARLTRVGPTQAKSASCKKKSRQNAGSFSSVSATRVLLFNKARRRQVAVAVVRQDDDDRFASICFLFAQLDGGV